MFRKLQIPFEKGVTPLKRIAIENLQIKHEVIAFILSEFLGSFILCFTGVGASAQFTVLNGDSFLVPVIGSVFGLMIAVAVVGGLSGAHINPAITFCFASTGEISWFKVPFYWLGQMFGSYIGSGLAYRIYEVQLERHFATENLTNISSVSGIFAPFPAANGGTPIITGLADQVFSTAIYLMSIYSVIDPRNNTTLPPYLFGGFLALVVAGLACAFGINAGCVLNPARDLGPRLMATSIGWKIEDVFTYTDSNGVVQHYWLIPLVGPFIGALLGAWIYIVIVGAQIKKPLTPVVEESNLVKMNCMSSTSTILETSRTNVNTEDTSYSEDTPQHLYNSNSSSSRTIPRIF